MLGAVVLAAGLSTRMGMPKMLMDWGKKKIIEQVVDTLHAAGLSEIVVVTGSLESEIKTILDDRNVTIVINPRFANGEMIHSLQVGLDGFSEGIDAAMVVLGDQPFIKTETIKKVMDAYMHGRDYIIMPSVKNRRGHPWIIRKNLWNEVKQIKPPDTMRDFFRNYHELIKYVSIDDPAIIQDMDTPDDYQRLRPDNN